MEWIKTDLHDVDEDSDAAGDEHDGRVQLKVPRHAPLHRHVHQDPGHHPDESHYVHQYLLLLI